MLKKRLDAIYSRYNKREYIAPDPLQFLSDYPAVREREIAGLVAALLAYGRVAQILKAVSQVLEILGRQGGIFLDAFFVLHLLGVEPRHVP